VKRTRRDEPIGVVIHTCMETTQGISLCRGRFFILNFPKHHVSCFIFHDFSCTKYEKGRGVGTGGSGEVVGKGVGG
jgi:hypothetical protein